MPHWWSSFRNKYIIFFDVTIYLMKASLSYYQPFIHLIYFTFSNSTSVSLEVWTVTEVEESNWRISSAASFSLMQVAGAKYYIMYVLKQCSIWMIHVQEIENEWEATLSKGWHLLSTRKVFSHPSWLVSWETALLRHVAAPGSSLFSKVTAHMCPEACTQFSELFKRSIN